MLRTSRDYLNPGRELDEPSVVLDGSPAPAWLDPCRELLTRGDSRGAFATMVKHAGFAPGELAALPLAGVRLVLLAGIRGREWQRTEALLDVNLAGQPGFQLEADGSASIVMSATPPSDLPDANWLPAPADEPFLLGLRRYYPSQPVRDEAAHRSLPEPTGLDDVPRGGG